MNGSDDSDKDKMVGYGHPPVATQFQKGQSGNPKGRPKGRKGVGKIFRDALYRKVDVREGERVRSMPKIEAAIEVNLNKALKSDHRAFAKVMDVAAKLVILELAPNEQEFSENKDEAAESFAIFSRLLVELAQAKSEAATDKNAPPASLQRSRNKLPNPPGEKPGRPGRSVRLTRITGYDLHPTCGPGLQTSAWLNPDSMA
jgi:hypothetical protein